MLRLFADGQARRYYRRPHLLPGPLMRRLGKIPLDAVVTCPHCDRGFLLRREHDRSGITVTVWTTTSMPVGRHPMRSGGFQPRSPRLLAADDT